MCHRASGRKERQCGAKLGRTGKAGLTELQESRREGR